MSTDGQRRRADYRAQVRSMLTACRQRLRWRPVDVTGAIASAMVRAHREGLRDQTAGHLPNAADATALRWVDIPPSAAALLEYLCHGGYSHPREIPELDLANPWLWGVTPRPWKPRTGRRAGHRFPAPSIGPPLSKICFHPDPHGPPGRDRWPQGDGGAGALPPGASSAPRNARSQGRDPGAEPHGPLGRRERG